jgi:four helix bundle protein
MGDFRELLAWQEAKTLIRLSKPVLQRLPSHERYALADQWRRAAYSVALNIAEGPTRKGPKEFRRYLDIARGSLHELEAIFEIVAVMDYLTVEELKQVMDTRDRCARMVFGLLRSMESARRTT